MIPVLLFPQFDPVLVHLGPLGIRWYALAYIVGLVVGWRLMRGLVRLAPAVATLEQTDDFLTWATLGVVLGGRLGYVLFYQPALYAAHPLDAFAVWQGGMSFHGGALGVTVAIILFCARHRIPILGFADRMAVVTPVGLFFGRLANFINGELWGRPAPEWLPWAMIFPRVDMVPRHPSQLYEALLEGVVLFAVMWTLSRRESLRAHFGTLTGCFLVGYGVARSICEFFRQPDAFLGYLWEGATMGQLLSLPLIVVGIALILWARRRPAVVRGGA
ncbi:MAG: prolipoprotein diacylglyceryl transferase [Acetobacteraceae bacterium]|nr:prolipoprotein diacylglyceryl transferase [Acetobacteraceae bacterium]